MVPVSAVPTDEIYERYLRKAITEINELGDEIRRAGDEKHVPVLGSGHPLADVFLLKYEPQASEVHRAGYHSSNTRVGWTGVVADHEPERNLRL